MNYLEREFYDLLNKDQSLFSFIQSNSLDGIWYWDLENPEEEWMDDKFWQTLGYDPSTKPHKAESWQNIIFKDDLEIAIENFNKHCQDENHPYDQIVRYRHNNGQTKWIHCKGKAIRDKSGRPIRMLGIHIDISNQKAMESKLSHQLNLLTNIIQGSDLGTWAWNIETGETIFNEKWAETIGYELNELKINDTTNINTWIKFMNSEDLKRSNKILADHIEGKSDFYECEVRMKHKNGKWVWVVNKGKIISKNENGEPLWITGTQQEITEKKEKEIKLNKALILNKTFIENAPTGMAMFDKEVKYIAASKKWLSDYGITEKEILGKSHYHIFPEIGDDWKHIHNQALAGKTFQNDQDSFPREDGSIQWLSWLVKPWYNDNNEIGGLIMFAEDITEKIKYSQELESMTRITQNQNERLSNFAHIVAHNLNSHVSNQHLLLDLIKTEQSEIENLQSYVHLKNSIEKLNTTVGYLNEIVQINNTESKNLMSIDIRKILNDVIQSVSELVNKSKTKIEIDMPSSLRVKGVNAYVESVFLNLITNSIKYKSDNINAVIKIKAIENGDKIIITHKDNGKGIDLNKHGHKIFGMFKTFHSNKDARGIGLFITKNQIQAMNGQISLNSKVNIGTEFKIELDKADDEN